MKAIIHSLCDSFQNHCNGFLAEWATGRPTMPETGVSVSEKVTPVLILPTFIPFREFPS